MSQRYLLLNADKRERHGAVDGRMPKFIFGGLEPVAKLLTVPVQRPCIPDSCLPLQDTQRSTLGSLSLPTELLDIIFERLDIIDAFCLGVTNSLLTSISWRHICGKRDAQVSRWAGNQIICLSDYADDMPASLDSDKRDITFAMASRFTSVGTVRKIGIPNVALCDVVLERMSNVHDIKRCGTLLGATEPWYPTDRPWALCNISKRQYVLAEAVGMLTDNVTEGPFVQSDWNLGNAVCVLASCSNRGRQRAEGLWAGDRMQIVETASLREGWEDVTTPVVPLIGRFLECMYPGDVLEDYADYYGPNI
ncbi:hypothetical protein PENSPDRAFT_668987 [Peniophora sp. CONT]|nr:hypothetical protein PENSPDRAFT_668987 [Peniophora sp. CONT]